MGIQDKTDEQLKNLVNNYKRLEKTEGGIYSLVEVHLEIQRRLGKAYNGRDAALKIVDLANRSEGYVRYLKHNNKQPSTDALAICSSKLKHYSKLLQQKNTTKMIELASVFTTYSTKLDLMICDNSTSKWMKQMNERTDRTVH